MQTPLIVAHRTCPPYAPENSLEGLRVSIEQGADAIEIDLRVSLDQRPFLMHDNSMRRTTGWPLPMELTPAFLVRKQRLEGSEERPPTLEEVLDATPAGKLLAVDVKTPWSVLPLVRTLRRRGVASQALIWCSSALVARYARSRLPEAEVAYYKDYEDGPSNLAFVERARRTGVQAVSLHWHGVTQEVVTAAHQAGLRVYSWHQEFEVSREKLESGLDGLITDHPERVRASIGG